MAKVTVTIECLYSADVHPDTLADVARDAARTVAGRLDVVAGSIVLDDGVSVSRTVEVYRSVRPVTLLSGRVSVGAVDLSQNASGKTTPPRQDRGAGTETVGE